MHKLHIDIEKYMQILHNIIREDVQMYDIKSLRIQKQLTQKEVADRIGMSLRSYVSYENDESKKGTPKYRLIIKELEDMNRIDEEHGILSQDEIKQICSSVFRNYNVEFCYLFGSYAKGKATETSDIDLLVSDSITGLKFYELVEKLRKSLHKKVDLLDFKQFMNNKVLASEVLKEGIKIYG